MKLVGFGIICSALLVLASCGDSGSKEVAGGVTDIGNSLAGIVVSENGSPVRAARVVAYYDNWDRPSIGDSVVTTTNSDGRFELTVDSGVSVVLYASSENICGLSKVREGEQRIALGKFKYLTSRLENKNSGYMRVIGSDESVAVGSDGSFAIDQLPPGDISLAYVDNNVSVAHLEFATMDQSEKLELPSLKQTEFAKSLLAFTDYRYYANAIYGGISVDVSDDVKLLLAKADTTSPYIPVEDTNKTDSFKYSASIALPRVDTSMQNFVLPVKIPTEGFDGSTVAAFLVGENNLDFEIDYWNADEALLWVRLQTLSPDMDSLRFTVVQDGKNDGAGSAFREQDGVLAAVHMNGDARVLAGGYQQVSSFDESAEFIGKSVSLDKGQFIELDSMDVCSGDYTISLWTKWMGTNGRSQVLFSQREFWEDTVSHVQWYYEQIGQAMIIMGAQVGAHYSLGINTTSYRFLTYPTGSAPSEWMPIDTTSYLKIPQGEWAYVTLVNSKQSVTMYVNGVPAKPQVFPHMSQNEKVPVHIGGMDDANWNGPIDEVRIENVARSPSWIKANYEAQLNASK